MHWEDVKFDSSPAVLERCAELYVESHKCAERVPQTCFSVEKLIQLLTYNPNADVKKAYNRSRGTEGPDTILKVAAGTPDERDTIEVVLFVNRMLRRKPPSKRTLKGASRKDVWNLSIGYINQDVNVYEDVVRQCRRYVPNPVGEDKFRLYKGVLNSPVDGLFDALVHNHGDGEEQPTFTMKEIDEHFEPWWDWGTPVSGNKREVRFHILKF